MAARGRIAAAAAQIDPLYSPGGASVHPHLTRGSLGQCEFALRMASRSLWPFLQASLVWHTETMLHYYVCSAWHVAELWDQFLTCCNSAKLLHITKVSLRWCFERTRLSRKVIHLLEFASIFKCAFWNIFAAADNISTNLECRAVPLR